MTTLSDLINNVRDDVERKRHKRKPFDENYVQFLHSSLEEEVCLFDSKSDDDYVESAITGMELRLEIVRAMRLLLLREMQSVKFRCEKLNDQKKRKRIAAEKNKEQTIDDDCDKITATLEEFMKMETTERFVNNDFNLIYEQLQHFEFPIKTVHHQMLQLDPMIECFGHRHDLEGYIQYGKELFDFCEPGKHLLSPVHSTLCSVDVAMTSKEGPSCSKDAMKDQIPDFAHPILTDEERDFLADASNDDNLQRSKLSEDLIIRMCWCLFSDFLYKWRELFKVTDDSPSVETPIGGVQLEYCESLPNECIKRETVTDAMMINDEEPIDMANDMDCKESSWNGDDVCANDDHAFSEDNDSEIKIEVFSQSSCDDGQQLPKPKRRRKQKESGSILSRLFTTSKKPNNTFRKPSKINRPTTLTPWKQTPVYSRMKSERPQTSKQITSTDISVARPFMNAQTSMDDLHFHRHVTSDTMQTSSKYRPSRFQSPSVKYTEGSSTRIYSPLKMNSPPRYQRSMKVQSTLSRAVDDGNNQMNPMTHVKLEHSPVDVPMVKASDVLLEEQASNWNNPLTTMNIPGYSPSKINLDDHKIPVTSPTYTQMSLMKHEIKDDMEISECSIEFSCCSVISLTDSDDIKVMSIHASPISRDSESVIVLSSSDNEEENGQGNIDNRQTEDHGIVIDQLDQNVFNAHSQLNVQSNSVSVHISEHDSAVQPLNHMDYVDDHVPNMNNHRLPNDMTDGCPLKPAVSLDDWDDIHDIGCTLIVDDAYTFKHIPESSAVTPTIESVSMTDRPRYSIPLLKHSIESNVFHERQSMTNIQRIGCKKRDGCVMSFIKGALSKRQRTMESSELTPLMDFMKAHLNVLFQTGRRILSLQEFRRAIIAIKEFEQTSIKVHSFILFNSRFLFQRVFVASLLLQDVSVHASTAKGSSFLIVPFKDASGIGIRLEDS